MQNPDKKSFACTYNGCSSVFNRPYRLKQHELIHKNIKLFNCVTENCTKSYTSKSHLDRHVNTAHKKIENEVIHSCLECMKKFTNRQNLKRHVKISHANLDVPYLCDICKRRFKKKNQLSAHMYLHNGIKSFRCDICTKDFISLYEKKKHMRNHKTYDCDQCPAIFDHWSQYVKHKRTEHASKEYICNDCGKNFKKKCHIRRHVKTHSESLTRAFLCPFRNCERRYSRNSNLRQHIIMRHERITYECTICMAQLCSKASLQKHIFIMHERKDVKVRIPKTLETGRSFRKDKDTLKCKIAALKLSGLTNKPKADDTSTVCIIDKVSIE